MGRSYSGGPTRNRKMKGSEMMVSDGDFPNSLRNDQPCRDPADIAVALHDRAIDLHGRGERARAQRGCPQCFDVQGPRRRPEGPKCAPILNSLAAIALDRADEAA